MDHKHEKELDKISGVETTGHEWDGLKELNNPAPRWWLWVFIITVIWAVGYWIVYPAWPTLTGHTEGSQGWTQYKKLSAEQQEIEARRGMYLERMRGKTVEQIQSDPELYEVALAGGKIMFKENCASCHGTGGQGGKGYPNLTDDDWIWGGSLSGIYDSIRYGVRSGHEQARMSQMPAFGKDGILKPEQIQNVASYVLSLSAKESANPEGEKLFKENCVSCHGKDGKGNRELGAPNLSDAIWLYGSDKANIAQQITNPRHGVMPTWESRLSEETIKQLAIYVHSLGGGEKGK